MERRYSCIIRQRLDILIKMEERIMKEHYEHLEMEIITFDAEDVIVTSGGRDPNEGEDDIIP